MSAARSESPELFWAVGALSVSDVAAKFRAKEVILSKSFICERDPRPVNFKISLNFGGLEAGFLSVHVINNARIMTFKRVDITIVDEKGAHVQHHKDVRTNVIKTGKCGWPRSYHHQASGAPDILRVSVEVEYEASPVPAVKIDSCGSDLREDYLRLLESGKDADVTFVINGEFISAHKAILSARSTYFDGMFHSGLQENFCNQIEVADSNPNAFKGLLHFLYGGSPPKDLAEIAVDLYVLADKYGVEKLMNLCESCICANLNADNVVDALMMAETHNREDLMTQAKAYFKANIRAVEKSKENQEKLKNEPDFLFKLVVRLCDD